MLASCGGEQESGGVGYRVHGTHAADREIPAEESRIRTIVGEVLEDRDDAVGEWARKQKKAQAEKRKLQRWLQPIDYDFGKQRVGTKLKAELKLENPTDKAQKITGVSKSCTCQQVTLVLDGKRIDLSKGIETPIVLAAGQVGTVEADVEVPDRQSRLTVGIRFETTDPVHPVLDAQLHVEAVRDVLVYVGEELRNAIDYGVVTRDSTREFEFRAVSRDGEPFEILKYREPIPAGMKIDFEKLTKSGSEWIVRGMLGPGLPENSAGGTVNFETSRGNFEVMVFGAVQPPIKVTPDGMVVFGVVRRTQGAEKEVRFDAIDPKDRFKIVEATFFDVPEGLLQDGAAFHAEIENAADGNSAKIRVKAPAGLRRGRFHIGMRVRFENDRFEPRKIRILGHAR